MVISKEQNKVSIIMPTYNCENFIKKTINSVKLQSYKNWELIIVDDCSSDNTEEIIKEITRNDSRVIYYRLSKNQGAAAARNYAIEKATGKYIAFLDSDDLWNENKLAVQISTMEKENIYFSCTSYNKIDEFGNDLDIIVTPKKSTDYYGLLKNCPGNSTVIYNSSVLGKYSVPLIKKRNDYLMWLGIIKESKVLYGLDMVLSSHRIRNESLSNDKKSLIKYHWEIYRKREKLSVIHSLYLIFYWVAKGVNQLIYSKRKFK